MIYRVFITALFLLSAVFQTNAQQAGLAIITDLQQEIKIYPSLRSILNEQSFPDYLSKDSVWQQSILRQISGLMSKKLGTHQTQFHDSSPPVKFVISGSPALAPLKLADTDRSRASYFVAINNAIALTTTGTDDQELPFKLYNFVSTLIIEDQAKKTVFTHKVSIPFRILVQPGSHMYGEKEISETDFKNLFEQALQAVFNEKAKRLALRTYYRPEFDNAAYNTFLSKTHPYKLQEAVADVPVQRGQPQNSQFTLKDENSNQTYTINLSQVYTGSLQNPDNNYSCRIDIQEGITQTNYQLWMHLNWSQEDNKAEVPVRCMSQGLLAGDFTLSARKFEGMVGYQVYTIHQISPKNTFEIVANNKLQALIQKGVTEDKSDSFTQEYLVFINKDLPMEQQAEAITVYLIYKLAAEFGKDFL